MWENASITERNDVLLKLTTVEPRSNGRSGTDRRRAVVIRLDIVCKCSLGQLTSNVDKQLLYILCLFRGCFEKVHLMSLCELITHVQRDLALSCFVAFISLKITDNTVLRNTSCEL